MPFRRFPVWRVDLGIGHTSYMPIKAMTSDVAASISNVEASWPALRVAVSKAARNWGDIAGWSNVPMRGWPALASCASVSSGDTIVAGRTTTSLAEQGFL